MSCMLLTRIASGAPMGIGSNEKDCVVGVRFGFDCDCASAFASLLLIMDRENRATITNKKCDEVLGLIFSVVIPIPVNLVNC